VKILVIGGGGREHALAWRLSLDKGVDKVIVCPGNPGMLTDKKIDCTGIGAHELDRIAKCAKESAVAFVVVGPDQALADGAVDYLESRAIPAFGPTKQAARIEWSKAYSKELMKAAGIPTAHFETFTDAGLATGFLQTVEWGDGWVIKADGLALGKGVVVCDTREQAVAAVSEFFGGAHGEAGRVVVIEERIGKREVSVFFLCDGHTGVPMGAACDYKRIQDGDQGPNTGGMGAYTPAEWLLPNFMEQVAAQVVRPLLKEMNARGNPFKGMLFVGLMVDGISFKVLEFNARFGDPETQALLPMLNEDLFPWLKASRDGRLGTFSPTGPKMKKGFAVHVVSAAAGYPGTPRKGDAIAGENIFFGSWMKDSVKLFFAGVQKAGAGLVTNGGRVLGVTALGTTKEEARAKAYAASEKITFNGLQRRSDVGK
jgi:phosphoribosylamine--glycine ligase